MAMLMLYVFSAIVVLLMALPCWLAWDHKRMSKALKTTLAQGPSRATLVFKASEGNYFDLYAVSRVNGKKYRQLIADTDTIRDAYSQLASAGFSLSRAPAWLTDPEGEQPLTDMDEFDQSPEGQAILESKARFSRFIIVTSLALVVGLVGATLWFGRHSG